VALATFTATVDHKANTMHFTRVGGASSGDGLKSTITPYSLNSVPDPTGVDGNPTATDVDLVSTSCADNYPGKLTFQCDVTLVSGFPRALANPYVQITNVTLPNDGGVTSAYDGENGLTTSFATTNDGDLTPEHGLWSYSNACVSSSAAYPYVGAKGSGTCSIDTSDLNTATQTLVFKNPDDQNIVYTIVVWATTSWATYTKTTNKGDGSYGNMDYVDACNGGTVIPASDGPENEIDLAFDFTLFSTESKKANVCASGELTPGSTSCDPVSPVGLPSSGVSAPSFFPFWEALTYGVKANDMAPADATKKAGRICYQQVSTTTAPNRIEVIEWRNMQFVDEADGGPTVGSDDSLDFEAFLYEGTNQIDLVYYEMSAGSTDTLGRATCNDTTSGEECVIGLQGKDAKGNGTSHNTSLVGIGPLGSNNVTGGGTVGTSTHFSFIPKP
jgi:hypothetical protein